MRSLEGNLKSADKLLSPPLHSHIYCSWHIPDLPWTDIFKHAQRYFYVQINLIEVQQFVSEISKKWWSICCVCCPNTLLKHVSFSSVIIAVLILVLSQQHCTLIKDSFKFKVFPKPQATHFPLGQSFCLVLVLFLHMLKILYSVTQIEHQKNRRMSLSEMRR